MDRFGLLGTLGRLAAGRCPAGERPHQIAPVGPLLDQLIGPSTTGPISSRARYRSNSSRADIRPPPRPSGNPGHYLDLYTRTSVALTRLSRMSVGYGNVGHMTVDTLSAEPDEPGRYRLMARVLYQLKGSAVNGAVPAAAFEDATRHSSLTQEARDRVIKTLAEMGFESSPPSPRRQRRFPTG